jgi:rhodanese-related sulfurtransferase
VTVSTKGLDALVSHWFTAVEVYEGCVEKWGA